MGFRPIKCSPIAEMHVHCVTASPRPVVTADRLAPTLALARACSSSRARDRFLSRSRPEKLLPARKLDVEKSPWIVRVVGVELIEPLESVLARADVCQFCDRADRGRVGRRRRRVGDTLPLATAATDPAITAAARRRWHG
jgi:hypothetical protein